MAYKPSRDPALDREPFTSMERLHTASRQTLIQADVVGLRVDEARQRVEAAGLSFRQVEAGGVQSADWSATRVTATVEDGIVRRADVR